jgi:hypothetical protein
MHAPSLKEQKNPTRCRALILKHMERICSQCHAVMGEETKGDWCPACGGAIMERTVPEILRNSGPPAEVDHRGIVLPRRHALGGIITPQ